MSGLDKVVNSSWQGYQQRRHSLSEGMPKMSPVHSLCTLVVRVALISILGRVIVLVIFSHVGSIYGNLVANWTLTMFSIYTV